MIEVLYCPVNNEMFLFTGAFEIDTKKHTMILYLQTTRKRIKMIEANQLVHIGWL